MPFNLYHFFAPLMRRFRRKRFGLFQQHLAPATTDQMLDVGGFPGFWTQHEAVVGSIDCLNVEKVAWETPTFPKHNIRTLKGNGCALEAADGAYDIVFSNSVIEHVGSWEDQQNFAREVRRVGGKLWVQTPAYECPVEPHYVGFYIHHLPKGCKRHAKRLLKQVDGGLLGATRPSVSFARP